MNSITTSWNYMTSLTLSRPMHEIRSTYPSFESMLGDRKVHIINEQMAGLGDVICLKKFLHLLNVLGINSSNILLTTINYSEMGFKVLDKDERIDQINIAFAFPKMPDFTLPLMPDRIKDVSCTFIFPGLDPRCEKVIYDHFSAFRASQNPYKIIYLKEYGYDSDESSFASFPLTNLSMGISIRRGEIGILISKDLVGYSKTDESRKSEERLKLLAGLPVELSTLILNAVSISEFNRQERLYYAYTFSMKSALAFAAAVAEFDCLKTEPNKNITIFFPKDIRDLDLITNREMIDHCLKRYIIKFGIGRLIILSNSGVHSTSILSDTLTKTMTLIFEPASHQSCITLLQASEKEVAVTGDQSFSEAVSGNKSFIYGMCRHKINLASDLIYLYKEITGLETSLTFNEQSDDGDYEGLIKSMSHHYMENLRAPEHFSRFNDRIITAHDCTGKISELLACALGHLA